MARISSTMVNLLEVLSASIKNLQGKVSRLESDAPHDKISVDSAFQTGFRQLKSEVEALRQLMDQALAKFKGFLDEADAGYIKCQALTITEKILSSTANVFSKSEYYENILKILIEALHSDKGLILLFVEGGEQVEIIAQSGFPPANLASEEQIVSRTLLNELRQQRKVIRVAHAAEDQKYSQETSILRLKVLSVLLAPLVIADDLAGCIYLESHSLTKIYTEEEEQLMAELSRVLSSLVVHSITYLKGIEAIHRGIFQEAPPEGIIGVNVKFRKVLDVAKQVAHSQATVLIDGESGTGKEVIARYIHTLSDRKNRSLVMVNCAAIPETLLESELFGHEKGAFTGALQSKLGRFELANGGTLFLDEIGEMPLALQGKLLRVLQFHEFERLGGLKTIKVDVRVIAATSRNLRQLIEQGKFHDALYFRLNVINIHIPPLRERGEDILLLTNHFLNKFCADYGKKLKLDPEVYSFLQEYPFPGNIRELENLIHRLVLLCQGDFIGVEHLPQDELHLKDKAISIDKNPLSKFLKWTPKDLNELKAMAAGIDQIAEEYKAKIEQRFYLKHLDEAGGNISELARRLDMDKANLYRKLKKFHSE